MQFFWRTIFDNGQTRRVLWLVCKILVEKELAAKAAQKGYGAHYKLSLLSGELAQRSSSLAHRVLSHTKYWRHSKNGLLNLANKLYGFHSASFVFLFCSRSESLVAEQVQLLSFLCQSSPKELTNALYLLPATNSNSSTIYAPEIRFAFPLFVKNNEVEKQNNSKTLLF